MTLLERIDALIVSVFLLSGNIPPPDSTAPSITLSGPSQTVTAAGPALLVAAVNDNVAVKQVTFYWGSTLLGSRSLAPWTWEVPLSAANNGAVVFSAVAEDAAQNRKVSLPLTVQVAIAVGDTTPPTVSLNVSSNNVTAAGNLTLTASASDDVAMARVEFYRASTLLGEDASAPYTLTESVSYSGNGTYLYKARAYDAAGNWTDSAAQSVTINIPAPPVFLTRSRKRSDYTLPNTPVTVTKAALLGGVYGSPNSEGWYEVPDVRCHSLTPGVPPIRVQAMDVDLKVKIIRPVVDGLGVPGTDVGGLIVAEGNTTVWVDDGLGFSSPPPVGGNGLACMTARFVTASNPRELRVTRSEGYGTGGIYVNGIAQGGQFRGIHVNRTGGFNIRGTGYNADGTIRFKANSRFDTSNNLGYLAQFFQIDNAPDAAEDSIIVEDWVAHNDPMAMLGRNAGQREDIWNAHASAGVLMRRFLAENGLPWDPAFTGTQAVYGADPTSPAGRGYDYSGSDGLGDGYTKNGFSGTPTANDVPHLVKAYDFTSLNNANVGAGVTAGNRCKFARGRAFTAGVIRSNAPGGYSRLAVKPAGDGTGETGNNACQAYQFYLATSEEQRAERAALFYGHEMDDLAGSFNWIDGNGNFQQRTAYIEDPNGSTGSDPNKLYSSFTFRQGGVVMPPFNGGIAVIPKPTSVAGALATLDQERQARIDMFVAQGTAIGMSDRPVGNVTNYWAGVP